MKKCTKCGEVKLRSEFSKGAHNKDGLQAYCKVCHRKLVALARSRHPETRKKNRVLHMEKELAANRIYKEKNKPLLVEKNRQYRKLNAEALKAAKSVWAHLRRAALKKIGGRFTKSDILDLHAKQKGRCAACRTDLKGKYHVDHVQPIAAGGSNDKTNLQLLCAPCNLAKGAKDPLVFMQSRGFLI